MKNRLTIGLLLAAIYLFWLLLSAPARLLALALPDGARLHGHPVEGRSPSGQLARFRYRPFTLGVWLLDLASRLAYPF